MLMNCVIIRRYFTFLTVNLSYLLSLIFTIEIFLLTMAYLEYDDQIDDKEHFQALQKLDKSSISNRSYLNRQ